VVHRLRTGVLNTCSHVCAIKY